MTRTLLVLTGLVAALLLWSVGSVWQAATTDNRDPSDAIVVLGAAQFDGRPSPVFSTRLAHAAALYADGVAPVVVTVGGKQPGDRFTEAAAGRAALIDLGVPKRAIVALGTGADTWQSMQAVAAQAEKRGWRTVTLVSDPAHLARSASMATAAGLGVRVSGTRGGPGSTVTPEYLARESLGLLWFRTAGRILGEHPRAAS